MKAIRPFLFLLIASIQAIATAESPSTLAQVGLPAGLRVGMTRAEVNKIFKSPQKWQFRWGTGSMRQEWLELKNGQAVAFTYQRAFADDSDKGHPRDVLRAIEPVQQKRMQIRPHMWDEVGDTATPIDSPFRKAKRSKKKESK
jgi:hypothetical protein